MVGDVSVVGFQMDGCDLARGNGSGEQCWNVRSGSDGPNGIPVWFGLDLIWSAGSVSNGCESLHTSSPCHFTKEPLEILIIDPRSSRTAHKVLEFLHPSPWVLCLSCTQTRVLSNQRKGFRIGFLIEK
jgi:hypothetical protein